MTPETMYKRHIMELYSEKPNFGNLENPTHEINLKNPACSDEIKVQIKLDKNDKIEDAKFSGKTCFISTVSASALLENIKGMNLDEIKNLKKEDIDRFLKLNVIPTRIKCELLPLEALKKIK
jgi:nitrogen fixation protein NifU and related proteins